MGKRQNITVQYLHILIDPRTPILSADYVFVKQSPTHRHCPSKKRWQQHRMSIP